MCIRDSPEPPHPADNHHRHCVATAVAAASCNAARVAAIPSAPPIHGTGEKRHCCRPCRTFTGARLTSLSPHRICNVSCRLYPWMMMMKKTKSTEPQQQQQWMMTISSICRPPPRLPGPDGNEIDEQGTRTTTTRLLHQRIGCWSGPAVANVAPHKTTTTRKKTKIPPFLPIQFSLQQDGLSSTRQPAATAILQTTAKIRVVQPCVVVSTWCSQPTRPHPASGSRPRTTTTTTTTIVVLALYPALPVICTRGRWTTPTVVVVVVYGSVIRYRYNPGANRTSKNTIHCCFGVWDSMPPYGTSITHTNTIIIVYVIVGYAAWRQQQQDPHGTHTHTHYNSTPALHPTIES